MVTKHSAQQVPPDGQHEGPGLTLVPRAVHHPGAGECGQGSTPQAQQGWQGAGGWASSAP